MGESLVSRRAGWVMVLAIALVVLARVMGPSDIYDKEQPRTTAYTADMLLNGQSRWVMPHDGTGLPATKPPLYNWLSVPGVWAAGFREWTLRLPSLVGAAVTAGLIVWFGRWLARRGREDKPDERVMAGRGREMGWVSAVLWVVSFSTLRLMYLARPDMVLVACTTGAWACGTMMLLGAAKGPQTDTDIHGQTGGWKAALGFWVCVGLAGLAKGPMALVPLIYVVVGAKLLTGRWGTLRRTGWWWGLPLALGMIGAWLWPAYVAEPEHFRKVLFGKEMAGRVGGPLELLGRWWRVPQYSVTPFVPWSVVALGALWIIPFWRWLRHPMGAAVLWIVVVGASFSCMMTTRADRFGPMFPATAMLAGFAVVHVAGKKGAAVVGWTAGAAAVMAVVLAGYRMGFSDEAKTHLGEHVVDFAAVIRERAGKEPVAFYGVGMTPLATLTGRFQDGEPTGEQAKRARWEVREQQAGDGAVAVSEPVKDVRGTALDAAVRLSLIRKADSVRPATAGH